MLLRSSKIWNSDMWTTISCKNSNATKEKQNHQQTFLFPQKRAHQETIKNYLSYKHAVEYTTDLQTELKCLADELEISNRVNPMTESPAVITF